MFEWRGVLLTGVVDTKTARFGSVRQCEHDFEETIRMTWEVGAAGGVAGSATRGDFSAFTLRGKLLSNLCKI